MGFLVLVRHGQSLWNLHNKFTGWVDVPLSEKGLYEALQGAEELQGLVFDVAFTSKLMRAHQTLLAILAKQQKTGIFLHTGEEKESWTKHPELFLENEIPIYSDDAINERYYGELQGKNKDEARSIHGEEQVFIWRRSWDVQPPGGEALKDTSARTLAYFLNNIMPFVAQGKNVVVSAHGNSLRAIIKHINNISNEQIPHLELPTGKPIIYEYVDGELVRDEEHSFDRPVLWDSDQH